MRVLRQFGGKKRHREREPYNLVWGETTSWPMKCQRQPPTWKTEAAEQSRDERRCCCASKDNKEKSHRNGALS